MQYSFDEQEAVDYGLEQAIVIWNLRFWIIKNKANNKHQYCGEDGILRTWTYNSHEAFQKLFRFWTKDQIRRILEKLLKKEIIVKGNFNQNSYNKTAWYAFKNEAKFLAAERLFSHMANLPDRDGENAKSKWQDSQIEVAETKNRSGENAASKTDIKPDIKPSFSSLEETRKYFADNNFRSDPDYFWSLNQEAGWKRGNTVIADREERAKRFEKKFNLDKPVISLPPVLADKAAKIRNAQLALFNSFELKNAARGMTWDDLKDLKFDCEDNQVTLNAGEKKEFIAKKYGDLLRKFNINLI